MKTTHLAASAVLVGALACAVWSAGETPSPRAPSGSGVIPGYRAISLALPGTELVFLKKGDRVDVLSTFDAKEKDSTEKFTATLLQNVLVLDVKKPDHLTDKGAVELIVNPNEGQYAALGQYQGILNLLIRADGDKEMKPMEMAAFRKLFGK
ncbi:MAG: hypothetical protein HY059_22235 [Proteobacteria bacterium]|nr:hypothetical protein [Pseudomonadota bacterium]